MRGVRVKEPIKATIYGVIEKDDRNLLTEDENKPGWKLLEERLKKENYFWMLP